MNKTYSGSVALTKLVHVKMKVKGKNGDVEGLFIPADANYLVRGKEGALYLPVRVYTRDEADQYGQNGFISQSVDSKVWKEADDEKKEVLKQLPILGNIKDFTAGGHNDAAGDAGGGETFTLESDDLPF